MTLCLLNPSAAGRGADMSLHEKDNPPISGTHEQVTAALAKYPRATSERVQELKEKLAREQAAAQLSRQPE